MQNHVFQVLAERSTSRDIPLFYLFVLFYRRTMSGLKTGKEQTNFAQIQ